MGGRSTEKTSKQPQETAAGGPQAARKALMPDTGDLLHLVREGELWALKKRDWYRGLSLKQLQGAQQRIDGKADEPDIARFRAFVKLASRRIRQK